MEAAWYQDMDVSKNSGTPKLDGENNVENLMNMDDLGCFPIFGNTHLEIIYKSYKKQVLR